MRRILVTGGAGFIGSHLCKSLLAQENEVVCFDNLWTGSIDNIKHLFQNKFFKFLKGNIIHYLPKVEADPNRRCPDITIAKEFLNWRPKTSLKEGLIKTINYFKRIL